MKNRKLARSISAIAGVTLALAGCAGTSSAESADDVTIDTGATISIGVRFLHNSWDPSKMPGATIVPIYDMVYDTLVRVRADLTLEPGLAVGWATPDAGSTWEFELRDDVVFSDGSTFDAQDVSDTLEYYAGDASNSKADLAALAGIEVIDDTHLRVTLSAPQVGFPETLSSRAGLMLSSDVVASGDYELPIGTGKFTVDRDAPGVQLDLIRNPDHWNAESVQLAGVSLCWIEDPTAMANAVRSGEIDMALIEPAFADSISAAGIPSYEIDGSEFVGIGLNPDLAPELADPRVRAAMSMAIDRAGLVDGIFFGHAAAANQFIAPGRFGFDESLAEIPYDLTRARALMAEAGYADGFRYTFAGQANNKQLTEALQASWAEIGIDVDLAFPQGASIAEVTWVKPTIPIATQNLVPTLDPTPFLWRHLSAESVRNPGSITVDGLDELIRASEGIVDPNERARAFADIARLTQETVPAYIPVLWRNYTVAYSDDLVGMQEWKAGFPIIDGVAVKK
ncbi:ABC transporter substrate-binding protein [Microbacterium sp. A196]|uniref:ABC transporter substrate-binding protein n=1 Tax=Microbacterium sp. A196 TaxID=3457320 RepID=UPI003FD63E49